MKHETLGHPRSAGNPRLARIYGDVRWGCRADGVDSGRVSRNHRDIKHESLARARHKSVRPGGYTRQGRSGDAGFQPDQIRMPRHARFPRSAVGRGPGAAPTPPPTPPFYPPDPPPPPPPPPPPTPL